MLPPPQGENDKIWQINLREGGQLDGSLRCGGKIVDGDLVTTLFCSQGKTVVPHALLCFSTSNFYFYFFSMVLRGLSTYREPCSLGHTPVTRNENL